MCYASPTLTMWSVPGLPPSWLVLVAAAYLFAVSGCSNIAARMSNAEGERLFEQARYAEAIGQFQRAIEEDPSDADGYYNVAAVYHREGIASGRLADLSQAERYYNLCLDHDPNHRDCYRGLAVLLVQEGHTEEAFRRLRGWCDRNPASSAARLELARLSEEFGDRAAARQHLAEALEIDPTNTVALNAGPPTRAGGQLLPGRDRLPAIVGCGSIPAGGCGAGRCPTVDPRPRTSTRGRLQRNAGRHSRYLAGAVLEGLWIRS